MSILSSTIGYIRQQVDGRFVVREAHTLDTGDICFMDYISETSPSDETLASHAAMLCATLSGANNG